MLASLEEIKEAAKKEVEQINIEKEYRMRQAEVNAANAQANAQAQAQANRDDMLNNINAKLNNIRTQQMINTTNQQLYNIQHR